LKRCRSDGKIGAFGKAPGAGRSNKLKYRLIFRYAAVWKRAIPALTAGIALFFTGCHAGLPPEKPRAADAALRQFEVAETCRAKGDLDRALAAYGRYLEQAPASGKAALAMERSAEYDTGSRGSFTSWQGTVLRGMRRSRGCARFPGIP